MSGGRIDDIEENEAIMDDAEERQEVQRKPVNFEQKNMERLEALKAKKAQEVKDMEAQREKMKRR